MELLTQLATQGLGYTLFVLSVFVNIYQARKYDAKEKELTELQEKRLADSAAYTKSFTDVAKEMVAANKDQANASAIMQKSIDSITQILQNWIQNMKK